MADNRLTSQVQVGDGVIAYALSIEFRRGHKRGERCTQLEMTYSLPFGLTLHMHRSR